MRSIEMRGYFPKEIKIPQLSLEIRKSLDRVPLPPLRKKPAPCGSIEIAGITLSAGKTRATEVLGETGGGAKIIVHPERWWENPYLEDPSQRFKSESGFLLSKAGDNQRISTYPEEAVVFQDVPPDLDWLYAGVDFVLEKISQEEFDLYQKTYKALADLMFAPDLIVFLQCDLAETMRRVRERGRDFEQAQGLRIRALAYLTERWLKEVKGKLPILIIDSGRINFNDNPSGKIELARRVVRELKRLNPEKFSNLRSRIGMNLRTGKENEKA